MCADRSNRAGPTGIRGGGKSGFTLLGVGAMASPRYGPAGLLIVCDGSRVMLDGGPGAAPHGRLDAWLVSDPDSELRVAIRRLAAELGVEARVGPFVGQDLSVTPLPVVHTSHATYGYLIEAEGRRIVWAPEFLTFPAWAHNADLMFAEAAGWARSIRFAGGTGGHASLIDVSRAATEAGVHRLVFAHIGRPTIRAIDAGLHPPFGEIGVEGKTYMARD